MSLRPVLVTQRLVAVEGRDEVRECLDRRWGPFLRAAGLLSVPLASELPVDVYLERMAPAGVLLTGGNDLAAVGGDRLSVERDAFETSVLHAARRRGLPVLGVCRGMQLMAHLDGAAIERCSGHVATEHALEPADEARCAALREPRTANSFHQFTPRPTRTSAWRVVLRSADGEAEALEHASEPLVAIMWHPERYAVPRTIDLDLFRQVFGA
ncbi:MAG TPA: gamma-glutamyl-gamma-aminobutyrate hydrolase family protein [Polyangiaceae bacterium]|nr:gamma-glutamyl-gamma-aminobutyrate hydrolase family protein [Polyangiaceae bacterium]